MYFRKLLLTLTVLLFGASLAHADLDGFLKDLDIRARADLGDFKVQVGAHFGVPVPDLDLVFRSVPDPADAFLCLWLGQQSRQPYDVVVREYHSRKGQGWGALAQSLGIKPGSAQFKALKAGNLGWTPAPAGSRSGGGKGGHDGRSGGGKGGHDDHGGGSKGSSKGHGKNK